jgi:hypothetical protein
MASSPKVRDASKVIVGPSTANDAIAKNGQGAIFLDSPLKTTRERQQLRLEVRSERKRRSLSIAP